MENIRVLVVDDSFFMRKMISDLLLSSGIIEVIDTAKNGLEAVEKAKTLSPDVITLDVEMPKMNGIEALQEIMKQSPRPVIMLSSLTKEGADTTIKALQLGAFDFVAKPSGAISFDINKKKNEIIDKILIAHKQKEKWLNQWNINNKKAFQEVKKPVQPIIFPERIQDQPAGIVAIGTSTGGPKALQEVITKIPKNIPYGILIVQHMPAGFTKSLADRLDSMSEIRVTEAQDQQMIESGTAYIAPGNYHMTVERKGMRYQINLNQKEPVGGHRPSVDMLFQSLKLVDLDKIFVIMTGMGSDGTKGLIDINKKESDIVIAEDESTCVVFGMPKSAIKSGLVDRIIPLDHISEEIANSIQKQRGWQSWK